MASSSSSSTPIRNVVNLTINIFWTCVYFVYFLFKGKNEWKCETANAPRVIYCCVDGARCDDHSELRCRKATVDTAAYNSSPKSFYASSSSGALESAWRWVKRAARGVAGVAKTLASKLAKLVKSSAKLVAELIVAVFALLRALVCSPNVPTQALPSTPKPYNPKPISPSYNSVSFELEKNAVEKSTTAAAAKDAIDEEDERTVYEDIPKLPTDNGQSFYYERVIEAKSNQPLQEIESSSAAPPPPTPPPPPPPKPVSREASRAKSTTPGRERKEVKGGIGGFKSDIMDELEEQQRLRYERSVSAQREMTQSCHPDMAQWKHNEIVDRSSANSTPWRASSVGPTMRRLEHVVSRIDGDEPSFVFRPKMSYSSPEYQTKTKNDEYLMGRSVFKPVEEAERMRHDINGKSTQQSYSSPQYRSGNWMENQRSRSVHRLSPYTSHTSRRSKTPIGIDQSNTGVEAVARHWPPLSNATGATSGRDDWVGEAMRRGDVDDDGLVVTMCRRVVEKKRQDNWKWRDQDGNLLDEKKNNTWKGELDTLLRDGPNEGRHWSRTVEKLPTGDTRFQDVNRQYNRDFVVESIVRNY
ncbi:unnamed protein product [Caenorhabditis bovis]|uniref:Uncharacterized protein n=1 Tax=Caenorhabditis bovis TaxID=2654633 RepID=A0A8S1F3C3_9PELO|nr:unnamed protein product [Caenorhabditis bovis]